MTPRLLLVLSLPALLSAAAVPQTSVRAKRITAPVRNAGTYHVATDSWTRAGAALDPGAGPLAIYTNNAPTGYFHPTNPGDEIVDEGRIPMSGPFPGPFLTNYQVNGFEVAYCTSETSVNVTATFFDSYVSCTDPVTAPPPVGRIQLLGQLPAAFAPGQLTCWIVAVDVTGTTDEFCILPEGGDGTYDADPALDSIGVGLRIGPNDMQSGFFIAGDPNTAPFGDGTAFQNPTSPGTGANEQDQFFIKDTTFTGGTGCFNFGGYPASPWGGHHLKILAQATECGTTTIGTNHCQSTSNSSGFPGSMSVAGGSASISANDLVLSAGPVPTIPGLGIFIASDGPFQLPLYNGWLCIAPGALQRINQVTAPVNGFVIQAIDYTGDSTGTVPLDVRAGMPLHFQYWFRDPFGGGANANFTDAIQIIMEP